jgi:lysophospholipase L1-like esterase
MNLRNTLFLLFFYVFLFTAFVFVPIASAQSVYGLKKVKPAFDAARSARVDFVGIGDSNQIKDGTGWDHGFQFALASKYGLYATGLVSVNENNGNGAGLGYTYNLFSMLTGTTTNASPALGRFLDKGLGGLNPAFYGFLSNGSTVAGNLASTLILHANSAIGNGKSLTGQFFYGTFPVENAGSFRPTVRLGQPPYTQLAQASLVSNGASTSTMATAEVSLPANQSRTNQALQFQWAPTNGSIVGPWFGLYTRVYSPVTTQGASYHTLDFRGGQSLRVMAFDLQQASDDTLTYYFSLVRSLQGLNKKVVIIVNSGVNDRNDLQQSVGINPAPSNTAAGYADNLRALLTRVKDIWTLSNWSQEELYFVSIPSHAVSTPEDTQLMFYRAAAQTVSDTEPRMAVVDMNQIATETEMTTNNWYLALSDHYHLNRTGYETLSTRIVEALSGKINHTNNMKSAVCVDC